jgi:putative transposase
MVEAAHHRLSITAQCRLLRISRSSYYYAPVPETDETLALMTVIDATFMECPWYGSRQMARHLRRAGHEVGRRRARRLMAKMGLTPIYQRPHERSAPAAPGLSVSAAQAGDRAAQSVWCADVTYIPMRRGFLYLVAIMDWATRKVLAWRLSNTMDAGFCVAALEEALARSASPRSSTPTRAASSPASPSPACCATPRSASAWMAGAGGWTMSSSNASGAP